MERKIEEKSNTTEAQFEDLVNLLSPPDELSEEEIEQLADQWLARNDLEPF